MFKVEILQQKDSTVSSTEPWRDHNNNAIDKLVFSKEHHPNYTPGHYPLESLGSLYRNIDDFRTSPFQSRTDWDISVPSVYVSPDGSFKTVDLLYFLESKNEDNFDLIGCEAILYDAAEIIYRGLVESVSSNGQTSTLRISDWLGNPKIGQSKFPVAIGSAELLYWPVIMTRPNYGIIKFEISARPLSKEPTLYIKTGTEKNPIIAFEFSGENNLALPKIIYSEYYETGTIKLETAFLINGYKLEEDVGAGNIKLPRKHNSEYTRHILRSEDTSKPDYYILGQDDEMEIVEAWSSSLWVDGLGNNGDDLVYPIGRANDRHPHKKGTDFIKIDDSLELLARIKVRPYAEFMVMDNWSNKDTDGPFQIGNPSALARHSKNNIYKDGDGFPFSLTASPYPRIRAFYVDEMNTIHSNEFKFKINFACPDVPASSELSSFGYRTIYLALYYGGVQNANGQQVKYTASFEVNNRQYNLPAEANGTVVAYDVTNNWDRHPKLSDMLEIEFTFNIEVDYVGYHQQAEFTREELEAIKDIRVLYARAEFDVLIPVSETNLYVSGEFEEPGNESGGNIEEGTSVIPAIYSLLSMAGVLGDSKVIGQPNSLSYGAIINREAFALRDRMRSLAAESATLIKLNPENKDIVVDNIALQDIPERIPIPMRAFLHEGIYSFKMESPDRSDIISGITINWGKDIEGQYAHTLSITNTGGILADGVKRDTFISLEFWNKVFFRMRQNASFGVNKIIDSEWIASWEAAENMAYNLLRWNSAPLRKAQARCIFTELKAIDIGTFVQFDLPGYPEKFSNTSWIITGRHDDLDSMVTTLELLEVRDLPAIMPNRYLLLEDGSNVLLEDNKKIKLEDLHG